MAEIFLVRHGQASFGSEDYDQLSRLGVEQCRILGQRKSSPNTTAGWKAPVLVRGAMLRHQQSMQAFFDGYNGEQAEVRPSAEGLDDTGVGADLNDIELPELNEFDHEDVLHCAFPEYRDRATLVSTLAKEAKPKKAFHRLFQTSVTRWISGEYDKEYSESWPEFQLRVRQGLDRLREMTRVIDHRQRPLVVFTSGGPISVILQEVLGLSDASAFAINENLANSGVTRLLTTDHKISASYINNFSHLEDIPKLISYR